MNLKKIKNKVLSFSITSALISSITAINAYAADNNAGCWVFQGGINKQLNEVKVQFKDVVAVIFGFLTLVALTVAVAKLVKGLLSHRNQGTEIPWAGIGMAFGATIVCGVVAGAGFFGWFGLS
mgnify:CR=1 FL=1